MYKLKTAPSLLLVTALASHTSMAGGKIGIGLGMAPDYEGSDDTEATPSLFGRY